MELVDRRDFIKTVVGTAALAAVDGRAALAPGAEHSREQCWADAQQAPEGVYRAYLGPVGEGADDGARLSGSGAPTPKGAEGCVHPAGIGMAALEGVR